MKNELKKISKELLKASILFGILLCIFRFLSKIFIDKDICLSIWCVIISFLCYIISILCYIMYIIINKINNE